MNYKKLLNRIKSNMFEYQNLYYILSHVLLILLYFCKFIHIEYDKINITLNYFELISYGTQIFPLVNGFNYKIQIYLFISCIITIFMLLNIFFFMIFNIDKFKKIDKKINHRIKILNFINLIYFLILFTIYIIIKESILKIVYLNYGIIHIQITSSILFLYAYNFLLIIIDYYISKKFKEKT